LGHDPGGLLQSHRTPRVPHVAAPSSFRAGRVGRVAGGAALLYRRRAARAALPLDAEAPMTIDPRHPLPGMHPLVVGAARSGLAAARLLAHHGANVRVCDRAAGPSEALAATATELAARGVDLRWGRDDAALLEGR